MRKIKTLKIWLTIPAIDLILFRPKDKIFKFFRLPRLLIRSMLLDDSDNFLNNVVGTHVVNVIRSYIGFNDYLHCLIEFQYLLACNEGEHYSIHFIKRRTNASQFDLDSSRYFLLILCLPLFDGFFHGHGVPHSEEYFLSAGYLPRRRYLVWVELDQSILEVVRQRKCCSIWAQLCPARSCCFNAKGTSHAVHVSLYRIQGRLFSGH